MLRIAAIGIVLASGLGAAPALALPASPVLSVLSDARGDLFRAEPVRRYSYRYSPTRRALRPRFYRGPSLFPRRRDSGW